MQYTTFICKIERKSGKIEILPNFIQRPKISYSRYEKIVSGELKGPFELHLDVIWGPEDQ